MRLRHHELSCTYVMIKVVNETAVLSRSYLKFMVDMPRQIKKSTDKQENIASKQACVWSKQTGV